MNPSSPFAPAAPRLVVFGLTLRANEDDVRRLLGRWRDAPVSIIVVAGAVDDALAIVDLPQVERECAWRLAQRLRGRRLHGRALLPWLPAMSWRR